MRLKYYFYILSYLLFFSVPSLLLGKPIVEIINGEKAEILALNPDKLAIDIEEELDIKTSDFSVKIYIANTQEELDNMFAVKIGIPLAFYSFRNNTIYIVKNSVNKQVLAHELTHAILCHYFIIPPSIPIQEIVAWFVTYKLNKDLN
jgi:hypothetical protein